jgi:prevent-host-death family protein
MNWKIAEAKKHFSKVLQEVKESPQIIYNRNTPVAVVITPNEFEEYKNFKQEHQQENIADFFKQLRSICAEEQYEIVVPERTDRPIQW